MTELRISDVPELPSDLEIQVDGHLVGVKNANFRFGMLHTLLIRGDVYIAHLTGEEKEIKKWSPTLRNPFRKVAETVKEEDFRFTAKDINLIYHTVGDVRLSIAERYGKVIENGVLSAWLEPLLQPFRDYERRVRGE